MGGKRPLRAAAVDDRSSAMKIVLLALTFPLLASCSPAKETYAESCSKPLDHWRTERDGLVHLSPVLAFSVDEDGLLKERVGSSERVISDSDLAEIASEASSLSPFPQFVLEVEPNAPCDRVEAVRTIMNRSDICRDETSLCSEGSNWENWTETDEL